ncbi:MAG: molybdopterin-synthase adenylyltransferase MoeB [Chloroflexi bacterium]|nr:molybdopterin-synthase adenylyltransferase MoeB [Chloroflexota bacterium]MDA1002625.1 molybdopterin-synthase adenylyltransferase MoeB [Chloroflexota bacterium]MQC27526.1 molybdopterin-synthase adenylyltransferase MoeB [Chloroflexota bacterium]
MPISVYIPSPFRRLTANREYVSVEGTSIAEVLDALETQYPGFANLVYDGERKVPTHINIYLNNQEIHDLQGTLTSVHDGDQVAVIPALAGGADESPAKASGNGAAPASTALTPDEVMRYSRHIIMGQVGPQGQRKLRNAKVLVIGAGGLGGPVALYLALAGVGTIGIVEFDVVDLSNLQRQILHQTADIGRPKLQSAKEKLLAHNPHVQVVEHKMPITSDNAMEIIPEYDIIVNGADNFATRYLVNDASYLAGKTLVDGAILLFDGQATVYKPGSGCYRCLYPDPPPPGLVPSCAEAGVLGAITGIVGSIQATEVFKQILEIGEPLVNRLLLIDALSMEFRTMKIRRDPKCPLCGDHPTVTELIDYDAFCGSPPLEVPVATEA